MVKGLRKTGTRFSLEELQEKDEPEPSCETGPWLHRAQKTGEAEGPRGKLTEWWPY